MRGPLEQDAYIRSADCYYMNRDFKVAVPMYNKVLEYSWPASDYATFQKAMVAGVNNSSEKISAAEWTYPEISRVQTW